MEVGIVYLLITSCISQRLIQNDGFQAKLMLLAENLLHSQQVPTALGVFTRVRAGVLPWPLLLHSPHLAHWPRACKFSVKLPSCPSPQEINNCRRQVAGVECCSARTNPAGAVMGPGLAPVSL